MLRHSLTALLVLGLGFGVLAALPTGRTAAAEPDAAKITKLIEQLGSATFDDREKATKDLDAIGTPALDALRKATKSDDAEISKRSADLVKLIEKRGETENVLKPSKIQLVFKDTPVSEAVAEIKKKSGYNIVVHDPENKLKDRKITLDTGDTTFWKAFDQFCEKAGVHEATQQELFQPIPLPPGGGPLPPIQIQPVPPVKILPIEKPVDRVPADKTPADKAPPEKPAKAPNSGLAFAADEKQPAQTKPAAPPAVAPPLPGPIAGGPAIGRPIFVPQQPGQITVVDGKPESQPTDYSTAVRVRGLGKTELFGPTPEGQILIGLEITPEPKITWQQFIGVKLTKAIDDNDQKLEEAMLPNGPGIGVPPLPIKGGFPAGVGGVAIGRPPVWNGGFFGGLRQYAPIRLKKGEKASKTIKELTGSISAEVLGEAKTLITTDEIMKSAGKTYKGDESGSIKIVSVDRDDTNGQVRIVFEFEAVAGFIPANGFGPGVFPGGGIKGVPVPAPLPLPAPPAPGGKLQIQLAPPGGALQAAQGQAAQGQAAPGQVVQIQVQVGGGVAAPAILPVRPGFNGGANGLKLVDAKGNAVEGQAIQMQFRQPQAGGVFTPEWVLTFPLKKDQTEAGKLTYSASKSVTVDIPFTLKDIVLP